MSVIPLFVPAGHWLDHEANNNIQKELHPVDAAYKAKGPGLCRWPSTVVSQPATDAGEDDGTGVNLRASESSNIQRKDKVPED